MDNHYVPNLTIGPLVCESIRPHVLKDGRPAMIDVHLMIEPVERIIPDFAKAGANLISFHPEASKDVAKTLQLIRDNGCQAGLVLNPATPIEVLSSYLELVDLVLLMSVNPGFGGQAFIPSTLEKIKQVRQLLDIHCTQTGQEIRLEVDGGIKVDNIGAIAAAGANTFVAGSAIFGQANYAEIIATMRSECAQALGQT
jgi:ribulose-phosphate 3-epimerase